MLHSQGRMEGQCAREPRWYPAGIANKRQAPRHLYHALFQTYQHSFISTYKIYLLYFPLSKNTSEPEFLLLLTLCPWHGNKVTSSYSLMFLLVSLAVAENSLCRAKCQCFLTNGSWFLYSLLMVGMDLYWSEDKKDGTLEPWGEWKAESMTLGSLKLCYDQQLKWSKTFPLL